MIISTVFPIKKRISQFDTSFQNLHRWAMERVLCQRHLQLRPIRLWIHLRHVQGEQPLGTGANSGSGFNGSLLASNWPPLHAAEGNCTRWTKMKPAGSNLGVFFRKWNGSSLMDRQTDRLSLIHSCLYLSRLCLTHARLGHCLWNSVFGRLALVSPLQIAVDSTEKAFSAEVLTWKIKSARRKCLLR